jgi:hypothetical protein
MATATLTPNRSATVIVPNTFTLTDKLRIQQERIRKGEYRSFAVLTTIVMERQLSTTGLSQSRPRWGNAEQARMHSRGEIRQPAPFSEKQATLWCDLTLDWLSHRNGPKLAISPDKNDLLLPNGLNPLPRIPDPLWIPRKPGDVAPRIEQKLESRACGRIRDRISGKWFLVFQPLTELCVMCGGGKDSGFGRIRCITDPASKLHASLLVNPDPMDRDGHLEAYFASGAFQAGY